MTPQKIIITDKKISHSQLKSLCDQWFGEMAKVVVDIERRVIGIGGELHADAEALLIQDGSNQKNIWGANYYPKFGPKDRIEYTALINVRPRQNNPSMEIIDDRIKIKLKEVIETLVMGPDEKLV